MAEITQKISALKKKISARKNKLSTLEQRISNSKREYKSLKKEIGELNEEIRRFELERLSETLEQNGITADDIAAAIAKGSIKKTALETEDTLLEKDNTAVSGSSENIGDTNVTENSGY